MTSDPILCNRTFETRRADPASPDRAGDRRVDRKGDRNGLLELEQVVGRSPEMQEVFRQIEVVAATDVTVLLEGETGTGKDLIAQTIHRLSTRAAEPFIAFNASNLQEPLFESELFGHVKGAFSGAHDNHPGLARAADGGTLFLDEVGELHPSNQAKLLRFLDSKEVRAVGATSSTRVDVRILCATNRDLRKEVEKDRFREDLYYRLRVISVTLPPLRQRTGDLPLLIDHFLEYFSRKHGKTVGTLSEEARSLLERHSWKGNVRELENEMERLVVMTPEGHDIGLDFMSSELRKEPEPTHPPRGEMGLREYRRSIERQVMIETLESTGWNVTAAARELDISRVGLTKKMKRLGVKRPG